MFDTKDHDIFLDHLQNHTGIQGLPLKTIEDQAFRLYLSDCYHFVYLNGELSNLSPVKYWVTQGSVLGPLLNVKLIKHSYIRIAALDNRFELCFSQI